MICKIFDNNDNLLLSIESFGGLKTLPNGKKPLHPEFYKNNYSFNFPVPFDDKTNKPILNNNTVNAILDEYKQRTFNKDNKPTTTTVKFIKDTMDTVNNGGHPSCVANETENMPFIKPNDADFINVSKYNVAFCILKVINCVVYIGAIVRDILSKKETLLDMSGTKNGKVSLCSEDTED